MLTCFLVTSVVVFCVYRKVFTATVDLVLLNGLRQLVNFYVPALFLLGVRARRLTWEGGVHGSRRGDAARRLLETCLGVQVHLTDDWEGKLEYSRTLAIALLTWQPWYDTLPGCCFAEESCEALLSRMASRCVDNRTLTSFRDMYNLFVSMPLPGAEAPATAGEIKESLVTLMVTRIRRFISEPTGMRFPKLNTVKEGVWLDRVPDTYRMPTAPTEESATRSLTGVLLSALRLLTARGVVRPDVRTAADALLPRRRDAQSLALLQEAQRRVQHMVRGRARDRDQPQSQRQPRRRQRQLSPSSTPASQPPQQRTRQSDSEDSSVDFALGQHRHGGGSPNVSDMSSQYDDTQWDLPASEGQHSFGDTSSPESTPDHHHAVSSRWSPSQDDWVTPTS